MNAYISSQPTLKVRYMYLASQSVYSFSMDIFVVAIKSS